MECGLCHALANGWRDEQLCYYLAQLPHNEHDWLVAFCAAGDGTCFPDMRSIKQLRAMIWLQTESALMTRRDLGLTPIPVTQVVRLPSLGSRDTCRRVSEGRPKVEV